MPETLATHDILSRLILAPSEGDIVPGPTRAQRLAALSYFGAGRVAYQFVPDAAPGAYTIEVGWYDLAAQERLELENGQTSLQVGEVQVEP